MTSQPLLGSIPRSVRRLLLFILLMLIALGLECLRLWQRSPRFSVSGTAIIGILLELDRHHRASAEAVAGCRILGGDDPGAGPGQSTQRRSVQVGADNDEAVVVPGPPGEGHRQADEVRYLDLVHAGLWLRHKAIEALTRLDRYRIFAITCPFHGNAGWRWVRDNDPDGWTEAVEFDHAIRHGYPHATKQGQELRGQYFLHRSCLPLDQVDLDAPTKSRSKKHLRLITSEPADVAVDSMEEDVDPDGCSPWSCRSGEPVNAVDHGHRERAA